MSSLQSTKTVLQKILYPTFFHNIAYCSYDRGGEKGEDNKLEYEDNICIDLVYLSTLEALKVGI